jgi:SAM-dependent methyltransferase
VARDERIYPNPSDGNFAFHLFRYLWAMPFAYDRIVLDAGCGSGYGAELLAMVARRVVGVDYDPEAVAANRVRYAYRTNLTFREADVADLSLPDESFDVIVSFEVYEHIERAKSERFLGHLARLCRSGGYVLLSTPNRLVETPFMRSAGQSYRYHVNSVSPGEFKVRLTRHFNSVRLFGQRVKAPPLKAALRALDFFNLRHHLLSYGAKRKLDAALSAQARSPSGNLQNIRIARSLVRQSGLIVALCHK